MVADPTGRRGIRYDSVVARAVSTACSAWMTVVSVEGHVRIVGLDQEPVVGLGRFPAHAADQPDRLHLPSSYPRIKITQAAVSAMAMRQAR